MTAPLQLTAAIGARAWREGLAKAAPSLSFVDVSPIHRAFAPMAREQKFDISEMAIVTAIQALAYNKPIVILPATLAGRFQQNCLIARRADPPLSAADLAGRRIGVRAYTQTTGVWLRGILQNDYGLAPDAARWVTQEGAHLAEYKDPSWVETAPAGKSLVDMLRDGDVDAAILGNDLPEGSEFVSVIADPATAAVAWYDKHGVAPINHMIVMRKDLALAHPDAMRDLWRALHEAKPLAKKQPDMTPIGVAPNRLGIEMMLRYCEQQKLLPRPISLDDLFADARAILGDPLEA